MKVFWSNFLHYIAVILILISLVFFIQHYSPSRLSFSHPDMQTTKEDRFISSPKSITISGLNINLPILPAKVINNKWETNDEGVSYLTSSPLPGAPGNSILYGHNWTSILGNLVNIKSGDVIEISYTDGTTVQFKVEYISIVSPNQSEVLSNTADKRLTIYTCTGFLDSKRFVVVAKAY